MNSKNEEKKFMGAIVLSTLIHIIVVGIFFFGFPGMKEKLPEEKEVMTFEMLDISEVPNIKNQDKVAQKEKEAKKSKKVKKTSIEPKPEPKPKKKIKKIVDKKKPAPLPPKKKVSPKPKPKKAPKKRENRIDSTLKNLEKDSEGSDTKVATRSATKKQKSNKHSRGMEYDKDSPLSITEKLLVKSQIERHWRPPVGAHNLMDVRVTLLMTLKESGAIKDVIVKNITCPPNSEVTCKLAAESAVRAVWKASPLENMLPKRYNNWKEFTLLFDPSFLAQ